MTNTQSLYLGGSFLRPKTKSVSLTTATRNEETFFKIEHYDEMNPFFMTVVSDADLWMFISSTGGLTCGRKNAESSLFPYYTDDKIHDSIETTGPKTVLIVDKGERQYLWEPFTRHNSSVYQITRQLYKNVTGNKIMFEEINHDLEVSYSYTWMNSNRFGFVKESDLNNLSADEVSIRVLDGIRNVLPYGVNTMLQDTRSTLVDGYKRSELMEDAGLGIFTLSSILTDKAEPSESLKATTVWSKGLNTPQYLLSEEQIGSFSQNGTVTSEYDQKGKRGAFFVTDTVQLNGKGSATWTIVAELNQSAADIEALMQDLKKKPDLLGDVYEDVSRGSHHLNRLVYQADGFQRTADEKVSYRHFSNTLYNIMRGGIYANGYEIDRDDFMSFTESWNRDMYDKHLSFMKQLPETIHYNELLALVAKLDCKDFERLAFEYLPLTFSRRHGDPSRPWNKFNIEITKEDGTKALKFEGNWRDIFQNWEALSMSYPAYAESIIAKFVNASTPDGYNPYRITKDGIDWETIDPDDPWSNIGYWGDHQIIYLLRLMELSKSYNPAKLQGLLQKDVFVYANVPYRIKGFSDLVQDPRDTITYDDELEKTIDQRTASIGSDGKLVFVGDGIYKVNLLEKLLVPLLSKLSNYVPEGGIWMNTQRPEWNDANNALVGNGLSMVTLYHLHRFLDFMKDLISGLEEEQVEVSVEVLEMFERTKAVFEQYEGLLGQPMSDSDRFTIVKALGEIGETHRNAMYQQGFTGEKKPLSVSSLSAFIDVSMKHTKDSTVKNKRQDGLYHSYNLIRFRDEACSISYLYEMLEGQVAVLSSHALSSTESLDVLKALRNSAIYREDQHSYMLYPNRDLPAFLQKNIIPDEQVQASTVLQEELKKNSSRFIEKDVHGNYHFNGRFRNGEEIEEALAATGEYEEKDISAVKELFSELFNHHAFTGRSGTFFKYEGLGSIYWHMVSKLVLAVQETFEEARKANGMNDETKALQEAYEDIKAGIGLDKTPEEYGAFPTEAYSHTPFFAGVQQPGMTGQVKEDFISRLGELGIVVKEGSVQFNPVLLKASELFTNEETWSLPRHNGTGDTETLELGPDTLGFTFCSVPVIYDAKGDQKIVIHWQDGSKEELNDTDTLDQQTSQRLFSRDGSIDSITVSIRKEQLQ
ncbi:hypothetical protein [Salisediminibacterium selenitireducens]|uniref:Cellobiose phosphorylase n=1 Tax=Bacillus selenitireducens (strain ATCC 700615 / DSM 15326 / MLS10) TaxID=439292 RepID=D6XSP6_BACIE|nr:hypothetical protein [Salisediminibacterium selenitireducens]ADH98832.1 conserved hypothetical protein [[Bacillus] selenitireducens MLS10]